LEEILKLNLKIYKIIVILWFFFILYILIFGGINVTLIQGEEVYDPENISLLIFLINAIIFFNLPAILISIFIIGLIILISIILIKNLNKEIYKYNKERGNI
jgi:TRAP-type C4-dicarboxylate transport system permease small subunit